MCDFEECGRKVFARGYCSTHYKQERAGEPLRPIREKLASGGTGVCHHKGCDREAEAKNLCYSHARHMRLYGETRDLQQYSRGNGWIDSQGYRVISVDGVRYKEHRYVMEQALGRPLYEGENVHHKNGDRLDNRPENLELWVVSQPKGQRPEDLVEWAKVILTRYDNE